jgi:hypothetical protein
VRRRASARSGRAVGDHQRVRLIRTAGPEHLARSSAALVDRAGKGSAGCRPEDSVSSEALGPLEARERTHGCGAVVPIDTAR